ncbi:sigma-70 family RNA polymerase sigma factor [Candidatus Peregrinibacteria bacterium]|nr:sigma-70 family RNA polymerase sigma factor [Candidatus Peregrinibacteria bacterium]
MREQDKDKKLVELAKQDSKHFGSLYDKYFDRIYKYVFRRVSDKETVHDLVSQTFFDALTHMQSYEYRGYPFSTWLYKIAHNNVLKWYRDQGKMKKADLEEGAQIADTKVDVVKDFEDTERKESIEIVLSKLEHEDREIIRLKFFEEVSNIEIAEIMGLSANHIGVKVFRALKKVKQLLKNS